MKLTRLKNGSYKFCIDLYACTVYIFFDADTYKKVTGFDAATTYGQVSHDGSNFYVYISNGTDIETVCHESYHIASRICDWTGMLPTPDTGNEHIAYLVGYIANKIWVAWDKECYMKH